MDLLKGALELLGVSFQEERVQQYPVFIGFAGSNRTRILLSFTGLGKVESALKTQGLILKLKAQGETIDRVFACGSSGGLSESIQVFDLVIATEIVEHDFKQHFFKRPPPRFKCQPLLHLPIAHETLKANLSFHQGCIASADEDIVDPIRKLQLNRDFNALAATWESAGMARACRDSGVAFSEIRCVTDLSDSANIEAFREKLPLAMQKVAELLLLQF